MEHIGFITFTAYTTKVAYDYATRKIYVKYDVIRRYECNAAMAAQILGGDNAMLELITQSQLGEIVSRLPKGLTWTYMPEYQIDMYDVKSSNVDAVGYDANNQVLYVSYKGGDVYSYSNVPQNYWDALQNADSKGSWIHWFLKINEGEFPYSKVSGINLNYTGKTTANAGTAHPNGYMTGFEEEKR